MVWIIAMSIAVVAFTWTLTLDQDGLMAFAAICLITGAVLGAELVCPPILLGRRIDHEGHRGALEASYFGLWNLVIKLAWRSLQASPCRFCRAWTISPASAALTIISAPCSGPMQVFQLH